MNVFVNKNIMEKRLLPIEWLHLAAGYLLIASWVLSYFIHGIEMFISWCVFGCMYISMSDIWENDKKYSEINSVAHRNRRLKWYLGALLSGWLVVYYLSNLLQLWQ